jgi:hypothetical protein
VVVRLPEPGSAWRHCAGVAVQPLQLLDVQPPQHRRREQPLEQHADPPPLPAVSNRTGQPAPSGVTIQVVTIEEPSSDSVSTRPGSGSSTRILKSWVRPPASS